MPRKRIIPCSVPDCGGKVDSKNLCQKHYLRQRNHGSAYYEAPPRAALDDYFWLNVNKDGPTVPHMDTPCWVWTGRLTTDGYGMARRAYRQHGTFRANRVALMLGGSTLTRDQHALHRCDVRACVRPDHLYVGDQQANTDDMIARGRAAFQKKPRRQPFVPRPRGRKLNEAQVEEIRRRRGAGERLSPIAADYGVTIAAISGIAHRVFWK